jgi:endonuclease YncB( thermonuclease family)
LDTATLFLDGKIIQLFGVEWVRGAGTPEDLTRYLRGREVVCQATTTPDSYRCAVDNQDLSKVVLFNGGGRANADVPPELKAAETAARQARRGLWAKGVATSNP